MNKVSKVSIIVPFYGNQEGVVIETLNSLKKIDYKNLKLIFVDNASTGKASDIIKHSYPDVALIVSKENLGVCGGRNLGIKALEGDEDFVIFFDSDQVADKNMVSELLKPFIENPSVGITTPKIYFHPDFLDSTKEKKYINDVGIEKYEGPNYIWSAGTDINLYTGQIKFYSGEDTKFLNTPRVVSVAPGVICCRIDLLKKLEKFDENYISVYEDTDFCFRAKDLGYTTYYAPKAVAWHKIYMDTVGSEKKLLLRLYFIARNRIIFMRKFSRNFYFFILFLPGYFLYYSILCIKYNSFFSIGDYIKGTLDGLLNKKIFS